jgi:curli biogenesis system outer membrane secretion channel CsgG
LQAQTDKTCVGILSFTYVDGSANPQDVNSIQEEVTNAFVKTKRFNIVDRSKMDAIKSEKELQKSDDFIDGKVVDQGKSIGAQYLISGRVISAQATQVNTKQANGSMTTSYQAKITVSLKVIDVATGQVIASDQIQPSSGSGLGGALGLNATSKDKAISGAIDAIGSQIDYFVAKNFPATFSIAEIQEKDKDGAAVTVLISGGSGYGLQKKDRFKVVEITEMEVDGKKMTRKKEIGELKITNVEDENFSVCTVQSGGNDIVSKFEAKAKLQVISYVK